MRDLQKRSRDVQGLLGCKNLPKHMGEIRTAIFDAVNLDAVWNGTIGSAVEWYQARAKHWYALRATSGTLKTHGASTNRTAVCMDVRYFCDVVWRYTVGRLNRRPIWPWAPIDTHEVDSPHGCVRVSLKVCELSMSSAQIKFRALESTSVSTLVYDYPGVITACSID